MIGGRSEVGVMAVGKYVVSQVRYISEVAMTSLLNPNSCENLGHSIKLFLHITQLSVIFADQAS